MTQAANELDTQLHMIAERHGVSVDAVRALLGAVSAGGGRMAQFHHAELGGSGQWMRGGMTMIGAMGNQRLQQTVSELCSELSGLVQRNSDLGSEMGPGRSGERSGRSQWWPSGLGSPSTSGAQNDTSYAYFPDARRLALSRRGNVTVYDTLEHRVSGVEQQQDSRGGSLAFTSQLGTFTVESLPVAETRTG